MAAVVDVLLFSPLPVVVAVAAGALLSARRGRRAAAGALGAIAGVLLLLSTDAGSLLLLRPLEARWPAFPVPAPRVDAVVVLCGGVRPGDPGGPAVPSDETLRRLLAGAALARRLGTPLVISGGETRAGAGAEARAAARALDALGASPAGLVLEERSRSTTENARNVAAIAGARGFARAALVTSAWHMPRAMVETARAGLPCVPAPAAWRSSGDLRAASSWLPSWTGIAGSATALREYAALAAARMGR